VSAFPPPQLNLKLYAAWRLEWPQDQAVSPKKSASRFGIISGYVQPGQHYCIDYSSASEIGDLFRAGRRRKRVSRRVKAGQSVAGSVCAWRCRAQQDCDRAPRGRRKL
jgi:hypothetical protein